MTSAELQDYLHAHIPLSKAMEVSVLQSGHDAVVLGGPLAPNINHRDTVFGGSSAALAILAAWGLLHVRMSEAGLASRLVIQGSTMSYTRPIEGAFTATATIPEAERWSQFLKVYARRGRARITVGATLTFRQQTAGIFSGEFVALPGHVPGRGDDGVHAAGLAG